MSPKHAKSARGEAAECCPTPRRTLRASGMGRGRPNKCSHAGSGRGRLGHWPNARASSESILPQSDGRGDLLLRRESGHPPSHASSCTAVRAIVCGKRRRRLRPTCSPCFDRRFGAGVGPRGPRRLWRDVGAIAAECEIQPPPRAARAAPRSTNAPRGTTQPDAGRVRLGARAAGANRLCAAMKLAPARAFNGGRRGKRDRRRGGRNKTRITTTRKKKKRTKAKAKNDNSTMQSTTAGKKRRGAMQVDAASEAREIRTPNLLIWSQTRCRCAIAPLRITKAWRPSGRASNLGHRRRNQWERQARSLGEVRPSARAPPRRSTTDRPDCARHPHGVAEGIRTLCGQSSFDFWTTPCPATQRRGVARRSPRYPRLPALYALGRAPTLAFASRRRTANRYCPRAPWSPRPEASLETRRWIRSAFSSTVEALGYSTRCPSHAKRVWHHYAMCIDKEAARGFGRQRQAKTRAARGRKGEGTR